MAHLPPNQAIFSPSVARLAASTAKDWNYIDSWLHNLFHPRSPPSFERNADTLRALLALALANETANEERALLSRLETTSLSTLNAPPHPDSNTTLTTAQSAILTSLSSNLSREGTTALTTMSTLSTNLGIANPTPSDIAQRMATLSSTLASLEQMEERVQILTRYIDTEASKMRDLVESIKSSKDYRPAAGLAKENLEAQRRIKSMSSRLPELKDRVSALASSVGMPNPTIEQIRQEEEAYLECLAQKNALDAEVRSFQGLPHDTDQARQELETLRSELRHITSRRDAVFEGLVERETPRKPARRP
ncbi:hypothetical protein B0T16DRAFT_324557 [Cercophora newfieldiana]|uniref:HAUS augmin-like complex subunit 1 n=1 Tax=Cercophora newfieldiana TaxID=92897 RepID=A0AA39YC14_9PEZI|nr:hypothetical protein B0T16DRAFT_324557 [Cercophora newfieldiana]